MIAPNLLPPHIPNRCHSEQRAEYDFAFPITIQPSIPLQTQDEPVTPHRQQAASLQKARNNKRI